ncbi:PAS domain S-box protein [Paraburkholderia tropica]|uniref:PAS domain S-box protein n=1 Tax=Paraburkholderia tropica TaxID=92647 RepID=UPI002AB0BD0A|nr:PAS domain S-box protein [Paraburkholderia tropica]
MDYREIFHFANDSMIIHDAETGDILEANDAAARLYGRSVDELRGMPVGALSTNTACYCQEVAVELVHAAARSGELMRFEWRIRRSDGFEVPVEASLKRMVGGDRPMVLGMARDISERKLAEARIRERSRYFSELIRNSSDGIALIGANGVAEYVSESLSNLLGVPARFARGKNVFEFLDATDGRRLSAMLAKARRKAVRSGTITYRVRHGDGTWRHHEAVFKNLLHDPEFSGVLVNFRDITSRVEQAEKIQEREQQLNHYARLSIAGETAAALAHELNQPLCAAVNFLAGARRRLVGANTTRHHADQVVRDTLVNSKDVIEALVFAQEELERAARIIQSVRQFTSNAQVSRKSQSLRQVLLGITQFLDIRARQESANLVLDIQHDALIECDAILLQQVVSNLAVNGLEAMADLPEEARTLTISTAKLDSAIEIAVIDNGCGFPGRSLDELPATFFTTKQNGVGLGLSLSRAIVESHGATLSFRLRPPRGTRFSVLFPVEKWIDWPQHETDAQPDDPNW